jgi:pyruvate kinase
MVKIAEEVERGLRRRGFAEPLAIGTDDSEIVAGAAFHAAKSAGVEAIVVFTASGYSARLISRFRPLFRVIAMTSSIDVVRRLTVNYGVTPVLAPDVTTTDEMLGQMDTLLVSREFLYPGNRVVFVAGTPVGRAGSTNLMKLHTVEG